MSLIDINDNAPYLVSSPIIPIPSSDVITADGTGEESVPISQKVPTSFTSDMDWEILLREAELRAASEANKSSSTGELNLQQNFRNLKSRRYRDYRSFEGQLSYNRDGSNRHTIENSEEAANEVTINTSNASNLNAPNWYSSLEKPTNVPLALSTNISHSSTQSITVNLTFSDRDDWAAGHGPPFSLRVDSTPDSTNFHGVAISFTDGKFSRWK